MMLRSPFRCLFLYLSGPAKANGAELPPTPTAAAPTPARFSSSRRVNAFDMLAPPFVGLPEGPACEACDEPVEERVVDERERDARDEDCRHDRRPVEEVAAN